MIATSNRATRFHSVIAWPNTVPRCHVVGATLSTALILLTAWVWALGHRPPPSFKVGDQIVDLGEAEALIRNADQWRELHRLGHEELPRMRSQIETIAGWLPRSVEFRDIEQDLLELGETHRMHVFAIQEGTRHVGRRVAVLTLGCEIHGDYPGLCRFLDELSRLEHPIACSELRLTRGLVRSRTADEVDAGVQPCRATLRLRVPYAAGESDSARLLQDYRNAS